MSNVTLDVAGRKFTVACAQGEEPHIEKLGLLIDEKLAGMPHIASQSEARVLLYAALLLADENYELKQRGGAADEPATGIAESLEALAARLEGFAGQLENAG